MTDQKLRVRVLPKGGGGRIGIAAGIKQPIISSLVVRSGRSSAPARSPEVRFHPTRDLAALVRFRPAACAELLRHCAESNEHGHEICGLLLGTVSGPNRRGQVQEYGLLVTDILPLETSDASGAHVSASPDAWAWADEQIQARFPDKKRLGWYHTHPTQGIFFSGPDKDFHSVFTFPYQFALVVDARSQDVGLFFWHDRMAGRVSDPILLDFKSAVAPAEPEPRSVQDRTPRTSHHLWIPAVAFLGFLGLLVRAGSEAGRLIPVALLFFIALLLRLWNSAVTPPPREEPEVHGQPAVSGMNPGGLALLAFALGSLVFAFLIGGRSSVFLPAPASGPPAVRGSAASESAEKSAETSPKAPQSAESVADTGLKVEVRELPSGGVRFTWASPDPPNEAEYRPLQDGTYPKNNGEGALLRYLLGVNHIPERAEVRQLQEALGFSAQGSNGEWGVQSRSALLKAARQGREIQIRSGGQQRTIAFRKAAG